MSEKAMLVPSRQKDRVDLIIVFSMEPVQKIAMAIPVARVPILDLEPSTIYVGMAQWTPYLVLRLPTIVRLQQRPCSMQQDSLTRQQFM